MTAQRKPGRRIRRGERRKTASLLASRADEAARGGGGLTHLTKLTLAKPRQGNEWFGKNQSHPQTWTPLGGRPACNPSTASTQVADDAAGGCPAAMPSTCGDTQGRTLTPLAGLSGLQSLNCFSTQVADLTPAGGAVRALHIPHLRETKGLS